MQSTGLISYLMYEDGEIVIDQLSPPERFGDLIDNVTMIYGMSVGKNLGGYLMGHAICKVTLILYHHLWLIGQL